MVRKSILFLGLVGFALCLTGEALAAEPGTTEGSAKAWIALASGLAIGGAAFGAALGQGRAIAAAIQRAVVVSPSL